MKPVGNKDRQVSKSEGQAIFICSSKQNLRDMIREDRMQQARENAFLSERLKLAALR